MFTKGHLFLFFYIILYNFNFPAGFITKYGATIKAPLIVEKLTNIDNQVRHIIYWLDDLLIVGQADASEIRNKPLNLNFGKFINEIIENVNNSFKTLLINTEELTRESFFIDVKLGRNIFINLLRNAINFRQKLKKALVNLPSEKNN